MVDVNLDTMPRAVELTEEVLSKAKAFVNRLANDSDDSSFLQKALGLIPDPDAKPMRHNK